ncbi:hypothetical protein KCU65_g6904, partial [Aureobasidium melanogenum]
MQDSFDEANETLGELYKVLTSEIEAFRTAHGRALIEDFETKFPSADEIHQGLATSKQIQDLENKIPNTDGLATTKDIEGLEHKLLETGGLAASEHVQDLEAKLPKVEDIQKGLATSAELQETVSKISLPSLADIRNDLASETRVNQSLGQVKSTLEEIPNKVVESLLNSANFKAAVQHPAYPAVDELQNGLAKSTIYLVVPLSSRSRICYKPSSANSHRQAQAQHQGFRLPPVLQHSRLQPHRLRTSLPALQATKLQSPLRTRLPPHHRLEIRLHLPPGARDVQRPTTSSRDFAFKFQNPDAPRNPFENASSQAEEPNTQAVGDKRLVSPTAEQSEAQKMARTIESALREGNRQQGNQGVTDPASSTARTSPGSNVNRNYLKINVSTKERVEDSCLDQVFKDLAEISWRAPEDMDDPNLDANSWLGKIKTCLTRNVKHKMAAEKEDCKEETYRGPVHRPVTLPTSHSVNFNTQSTDPSKSTQLQRSKSTSLFGRLDP